MAIMKEPEPSKWWLKGLAIFMLISSIFAGIGGIASLLTPMLIDWASDEVQSAIGELPEDGTESERDEWMEEEAILTETFEYMEGMKTFFTISGVSGCIMALVGIFSVPVLWSGDRNLGLKMVAGAFSINLFTNLGAQFYLYSGPGFMPDYGLEDELVGPQFMDAINSISFVSNLAGLICCNLVLFSILALVASQTKPMGPVELKSGFHVNNIEDYNK